MTDYLHPLRFGSFITPSSATPQLPVDRALLSEELGLDLVTFQDHPYQAQFLDTWTLISVVAARTERIHVSGNVLNLPLRQPAVLARSLASLFGAVVSFEFEAHPVSAQVGFAMFLFTPDDAASFLEGWGTTIEGSHPSVTGSLMISPGGRGSPAVIQAMIVVDSSDPDTVVQRLEPLAALAPLANQSVTMVPYAALLEVPPDGDQHGQGEPRSHSGFVRHLTTHVARGLADLLASGSPFLLSIRSSGGAAANHPADSTAYGWRAAEFLISILGSRSEEVQRHWSNLVPLFEGLYISFETDTGPDVLARAFPPGHLRRLRALKAVWDPTGLFRDNFYITPEPDAGDAPPARAVRLAPTGTADQ